MLKDEQIDELIQPIINLYNNLEYDLMVEIAQCFKNADSVKGVLEWQLKKLDELGGVNHNLVKLIKQYSSKTDTEIISMLEAAGYANIDTEMLQQAFHLGAISVNPEKIMESPVLADTVNLSYKSLKNTFSLINTKALESAKQSYLNIINTSYLDVASGMHSLQESIKKGVQRMAQQGFTAATYKRGNKIVKYSIEGVVRRDALTAVHQLANRVSEQSCEIMGAEYVEISQHLGARVHPTNPIANHAGWQGKVFKLNGSDDEYENLQEATGYPDDILGLGGVNCRHRMFPFFPGISIPNPIHYDEEKNKKRYEATQQKRKLERDIRSLKKKKACADAVGDEETSAMLQYKLDRKYEEINNFCDTNGLKRDYSRELVSEQIPNKTVAKPADSGIILTRNSTNDSFEESDSSLEYVKDVEFGEDRIKQMVDDFEKEHAFSDVEYARVLTKNGKLYSVKGTSSTVDIESFIPVEELRGAVVIHNHPVSNDDKFADAFSFADLSSTLKNQTSMEYLITGIKKYSIEFKNFDFSFNELQAIYNKAKYTVWQKVIDGSISLNYMEQYEIMKVLSEIDERFVFYEL